MDTPFVDTPSPAEGLRQILVDSGILGGESGWKWQVGGVVDLDYLGILVDSGGRGGEVKVSIDYPSVQVIVQGSNTQGGYTAAHSKARQIYGRLHGCDTPNESYPELVSCVAKSYPTWMGRDDKNRPMFTINFGLIIVPINVGDRTY